MYLCMYIGPRHKRVSHSATAVGRNFVLVFGGLTVGLSRNVLLNTIEIYHVKTKSWVFPRQPSGLRPPPLHCHSATLCNGHYLYILGGLTLSRGRISHFKKGGKINGENNYENLSSHNLNRINHDIFRLNLKTWIWEKLKICGPAPAGLVNHSTFALNPAQTQPIDSDPTAEADESNKEIIKNLPPWLTKQQRVLGLAPSYTVSGSARGPEG